ncbi:MAG: hypothetical protein CML08_01945 [Puniceicoccaceae bacterium]|nr:hypothetical protein [Puniceicoccaceae bacterium]
MFNQQLELFQPNEYNKRVLVAVWALVFSKCFILEYYIEVFDIPINSLFYIWTLSLSAVSILSLVYFKRSLRFPQITGRISVQGLLSLCLLITFFLIHLAQFIFDCFTWAQLLSLQLSLLGFFFAIKAYIHHHRWDIITAAYLIFSAIPLSLSPSQSVNLYTSFLLIILAIQLILDLMHYRRNSIHPE